MCYWQRPYSKCNPREKEKRGNKERVTEKLKKEKKKGQSRDGKESRGTSGVQSCPHTMGRVTHITQYAGSYTEYTYSRTVEPWRL